MKKLILVSALGYCGWKTFLGVGGVYIILRNKRHFMPVPEKK